MNSKISIRLRAILCLGGITLLAGACGSSKSSSDTPTTTTTALTASFTNVCAVCHGADGATKAPGTTVGSGVIKGTTLTEAEFLSIVRQGKGTGMTTYSTSQMSNADVSANWKVLAGK